MTNTHTLPYHYRDNGAWCPFSLVEVQEMAGCPYGCDGARYHYANDGHPDCSVESPR